MYVCKCVKVRVQTACIFLVRQSVYVHVVCVCCAVIFEAGCNAYPIDPETVSLLGDGGGEVQQLRCRLFLLSVVSLMLVSV